MLCNGQNPAESRGHFGGHDTWREGANLRAGSARRASSTCRLTRMFPLTEGKSRLTAGSRVLLGLAFQPGPDYDCIGSLACHGRRILERATVRIGHGEKISMSTSSSDVDGSVGSGKTNSTGGGSTAS